MRAQDAAIHESGRRRRRAGGRSALGRAVAHGLTRARTVDPCSSAILPSRFGAKRVAPAVSLGTLILSCQLADLVWPTLVLLGIEHVVDRARHHRCDAAELRVLSLLTQSDRADLLGRAGGRHLSASRTSRRRRRPCSSMAGVVLSHWFLDVATHRPDMPLVPGESTKVGLGLWNSLAGDDGR